jgi:predicted amidohydrolase YtcJ
VSGERPCGELLVTGQILSFDQGERPFSQMLIRDGRVAALSREPLPHTSFGTTNDEVRSTNVRTSDFGLRTYYVRTTDDGRSPICIVPAFIDSHVHIFELGLQFIFPSFNSADSLDAVFDRLSSARGQARELGFMLGFNLDPDNLREKRMPSCKELDRVIAEWPVLVYRIDGHSASLNSHGLEMAAMSRAGTETTDEHGLTRCSPVFTRGSHLREPSGIVTAQAYEAASRAFKNLVPAEIKQLAFRKAAEDALRKGVLTVGALCGSDEPGDDIPELLVQEKELLPIHVEVFPQTLNIARVQRMGSSRIGGCILIDGSFGSHSAALLEDYADSAGSRGNLYFDDTELGSFFRSADKAGLQVAVHAIGDRAVTQVVECWERIIKQNPPRHRIEHAELLSPNLIDRISRLGLVLGVQPAFEHYWGGGQGMYQRRLGERYLGTNPYRELLEKGVTLAGGSDAPITMIDPLLGINTAASHPVAGHSVSRLAACRMFTDRAAFSLGCEERKGSLRPGCDADFAVLSNNPLQHTDFSVVRLFRQGQEVK